MARFNRKTLRKDADFTEDTVGLMIESFLTALSFPRRRFSIEPFSRDKERWMGADARVYERVEGFKPFYMQFKRPSAYPDSSLSKIVAHRKSVRPSPLTVTPWSLFFELRDKRPAHHDYQHNVLFKLRRRLLRSGLGDAAYICPLFLERSAYRHHLHFSALRRWGRFWRMYPWEFGDISIEDPSGRVQFSDIPLLAEHVSIPPHALVSDARHSYSFTETGSEVCFHSPEALPEGVQSLASWMKTVLPTTDDQFVTQDSAMAKFKQLFAAEKPGDELALPDQLHDLRDGMKAWLAWGDFLRESFSIEQFAFVRWKE